MIKHINKNWTIYAWYFVIIIGLIITIAPFWWALSSSFKDNVTIFAEVAPFSFKSMVPGTSLDPYYGIFEKGFGRAMVNTFFVSKLLSCFNTFPALSTRSSISTTSEYSISGS